MSTPEPSSPPGASLFGPEAAAPAAVAATSDAAWVRAMLDVEGALALAAADCGLVGRAEADAVAAVCAAGDVDLAALAHGAATDATPVVALVEQLRAQVPPGATGAVHVAATSQDVLDTAAALVARAAVRAVLLDADAAAHALAGLAREHRDSVQIGRTLLQHAVPTTFGALAAARLVALDDARTALAAVVERRLAVQLGGAAGTLAPAGDRAPDLVAALAARLGLAEPVVPWHTSRGRWGQLAGALGVLTGELAAVAQDLVLLASSDVAEVLPEAPGRSSAMPHKRNAARAVLAVAAAHRVPGLVATVLAGMPQELQRAAGRWQAEQAVLTDLLRLTGATAAHTAAALDGVHVDVARMRATAAAAVPSGQALDVGSAGLFVDRALAAHDLVELPATISGGAR